MKNFFYNNRLFFMLFILFIGVGAVLLASIDKGDLILFFSAHRSPFGDFFFKYGTKIGEEWAYILSVLVLLFYKFRYVICIPIIGILVALVSFSLKSFFGVYRPSTFFKQEGIWDNLQTIEGVVLHAGPTSFPSGHTMSGFALFGFLALVYYRRKSTAFLFFILALIVGLSRVYLVQHFWVDVYVGAICGVLLAILVYALQAKLSDDPSQWWNKNLGAKTSTSV